MAKRTFMIKDSLLDPYERKILNKRTDESYVVTGCAGSGKSLIALMKAKDLQDKGKSYLIIVYNRTLSQYMHDAIKELELKEDHVTTYGKCFSWRKNENGIWEHGSWKRGHYDYILVDEAQDLSAAALDEIKMHCTKILIFGDSAQSLYTVFSFDNNPTISIDNIASRYSLKTELLIINHRMPKTIARVAQYLNKDDDVLEERCANDGISKPIIMQFDNFEIQLDNVAKIIKNKNLEDVGIFAFHKEDVQKIGTYLSNKGLSPEIYYSEQNMQLDFSTTNPKVMTFKSSKGLQFETVFILGCDQNIGLEKSKSLYVAMTRSYQDLFIFYSGEKTSLFDAVSSDLYDTHLGGSSINEDFEL